MQNAGPTSLRVCYFRVEGACSPGELPAETLPVAGPQPLPGAAQHLVARGNVAVSDGFAACREDVPVRMQRKVAGDWYTIASTFTESAGAASVSQSPTASERTGRWRRRWS